MLRIAARLWRVPAGSGRCGGRTVHDRRKGIKYMNGPWSHRAWKLGESIVHGRQLKTKKKDLCKEKGCSTTQSTDEKGHNEGVTAYGSSWFNTKRETQQ